MVKKILYVTNIRMPSERAHATQVVNMCNAFVQIGVGVDLIVSNRPTAIAQSPEEYYGQSMHFQILKRNTFNQIHWGAPFYYFSTFIMAIHAIFCFYRSHYDAVYARDEFILFIMSWFINTKLMVWESHQARYDYFSRSILRRGVKLVVISEGIRDVYIKNGIKKKQVLIAHDGIDNSFFKVVATKFEAREKLNLPQDKSIAMYIGGFDLWKGVNTFCAGASLVEDVLFVAIGGTKQEIEEFSKKYPEVVFLGAHPYKELKDHQQAADVLVIPNTATTELSASYTSPLKLFAHMTSKVPIVAARVPSVTNVVSEEMAYFFEPDNQRSLAEVIQNVLKIPEEAAVKVQSAFEVSKRYTWEARAKSIENFVRSA